jgi:hypothetical protein
MKKAGCAAFTTSVLLVELVKGAALYHLEKERYQDEPHNQTFENAVYTATVNVMPYFQFGGALIEPEGPRVERKLPKCDRVRAGSDS